MSKHSSPNWSRLGPKLVVWFWAFSAMPAAPAQTLQIEANPQAEAIIQHMERDVFVEPGLGLKRVHIGQSFRQVAKTWGLPNDNRRGGIFGGREWLYLAEDGTQILVAGKKFVESMTLFGAANSPYQTLEGARFGMAPYQVVALYGASTDYGSAERQEYPSWGVSFEFSNGALSSIEVYRAKSP